MSKKMPLTQGKYAIVDDKDYEWLNQWKWHHSKNGDHTGYAVRRESGVYVFMHRVILGLNEEEMGDHINGNGLDNRRENLRKCTSAQNNQNSRKQKNNSSGYMGVSWEKLAAKWRARICYDGTKKHIGLFDDIKEAAIAYDESALKYHGEFATLNFPERLS